MPTDSPKRTVTCPHCGKSFSLDETESPWTSRSEPVSEEPRRSAFERGPIARADTGSIWERRSPSKRPSEAGWPVKAKVEAFSGAEKRAADVPERPIEPAKASYSGWATRREPDRPEKPAEPPRAAPPREERPRTQPRLTAVRDVRPKAPSAELRPEPEPRTRPVAEARPEPAPAAPPPGSGPSIADVLDTDPSLNAGQRETIRTMYSRFAKHAVKQPAGTVPAQLTVMDVLDADPYINRGQKETIRTVYSQFVPRKR